jgi:hypothetical protein
MLSQITTIEDFEQQADAFMADCEADHTFALAPLSPIHKPQRKRSAEAENRDPDNMMHLHVMFVRWLKSENRRPPESDPAHTCSIGECFYFRRGSYYICLKTGRMHHCTLESCTYKQTPPPIQLANGTILRQVDRLVCTITGEGYEPEPQLDYEQETIVRSGVHEEKDSVEPGVAVTVSARHKRRKSSKKNQVCLLMSLSVRVCWSDC